MNIYQSINKAMAQIGAVGKDSKVESGSTRYMYRGIDAVMNALNPALISAKIFVVPTVLEQTREERETVKYINGKPETKTILYSICKVKYTFYAEDGSSVEAVTIGEGMDSGDKATNKAMSIAFKYACFQVFCIPTEEMVDPDAEVHEVKPKQTKKEAPKQEAKAEPKQETKGNYAGLISPEQKAEVLKEINRTHVSPAVVCKSVGAKSIDDIPADRVDYLMDMFSKTRTYDGGK